MSAILHAPANVSNRTTVYPIDLACQALRRELQELGYNPMIISEILPFAHDEGCLTGAIELGMVDLEDVDRLTTVFVESFPAVHESHPDWNDAAIWSAPIPSPAESRELAELVGTFDAEDAPLVPPADIEPIAEDWAGYDRWSALMDPQSFEEAELSEIGISRR